MSVRSKFFLETLVSVFLGFLVFIFILAISYKKAIPLDVTNNGRFTLSEQSSKAIQNLEKPIHVLAFVDEASKPKVQELMLRYQRVDPAKFSYELVFPKMQPRLAESYDVRAPGTAVVEIPGSVDSKETPAPSATPGEDEVAKAKTQRARAASLREEDITNAIMKLGRHADIKIYALTGHGERSFDGNEDTALSQFKGSLGLEGFTLGTLDFSKDKTVPADCKVLIIAAPKTPLLAKEEELVRAYLKNDGRIFLMIKPDCPEQFIKLATEYGVSCPDQVIIDPTSALLKQEPVFALGVTYAPDHPITKDFKQTRDFRDNTLFQLARPVTAAKEPPAGSQVTTIVSTSNYAMALPASEVIGKSVSLDEKKYPPGVQGLAVAGSYPHPGATPLPTPAPGETPKKNPESRLVVVGDVDFLGNANYRVLGARDFGLNIVNWLAEAENQISIRSKDAEGTPMRMTENDMRKLFFFQCILVPLAVVFLGLSLSWRRR